MTRILSISALVAGLTTASLPAAITIENYSSGPLNLSVPDGNPAGLANVINVPASAITNISDISVTLNISGTWNGDLYATLQHSTGFAVLLNRVGRTGADAFGYGDLGFQVTFNDLDSFADIHGQTAAGALLAGDFASDGRLIDPDLVVDTDPRSALLTSFVGTDANGTWTLFVADLSGGDSHVLQSWDLEITAVPEPTSMICLLAGSVLLVRRKRSV